MKAIALVVAAGSSTRFEGDLSKVYCKIGETTVLSQSVGAFSKHPMIDAVCVVINPRHVEQYQRVAASLSNVGCSIDCAFGGETRMLSVRNGLEFAARYAPQKVLIHDAARPFVSSMLITNVLKALDSADAVDVLLPVVDTIKRIDKSGMHIIEREGLYQTQTPQGFTFSVINQLHREATEDVSDDISLCLKYGVPVSYVKGEIGNYKITFVEDLLCK